MEQFVIKFAQYGLLGIVAAAAVFGYLAERKKVDQLRADQVAQERQHSDALRSLGDKHALALTEQGIGFAEALKELDKNHHEQEDELVKRLLATNESYAQKNALLMEKNGQLTEKVAELVKSMAKGGG